MNLTEALNVALPDLPARSVAERVPRLHPGAVFREHLLDGKAMVRVAIPENQGLFTFSRQDWQIIQLFDGCRSYQEISDLNCERNRVLYTPEQVRQLASELDAINFWYRTQQEKNVLWLQKSAAERRELARKGKTQWGDLSTILFPAVNPDGFLEWLHARLFFIYTWWFTLLTLTGFFAVAVVFVTHWGEIGRDTLLFYDFKDKTLGDIAQFWLVGTILMAIHEIGHGLTTKHYGGHVKSMGFALVYLTPAFYTDTSEGEVLGDPFQRTMITISGVWVELMMCTIATFVWWGTPRGTAAHDFAYLVILLTGIAVVLINWNPLIKLDGYYILTELIGIVDLKEDSTLFVSAWVKKNIWGLPVEVPYVPKKRRIGYAIYALLSGIYSYSVLYLFAGFVGNIFRNFNPDWAFVPEIATAGLIFRSRIRTLANFMKFVYLDKKDRIHAWFTRQRRFVLAGSAIVVLLAPVFHDSADGRFVLEAKNRAIVRALVPGTVTDVGAEEGQPVSAGSLLVQLRNVPLQSQVAHTAAEYALASSRAASAVLHYSDVGPAIADRDRLEQQSRSLAAEASALRLSSPISGVVETPRLADRLGSYVTAGTEVVEVADMSTLRARIYVSEHDVYKLHIGASARLLVDGGLKMWSAEVAAIEPLSGAIAPGLIDLSKYAGMSQPNFYVVDLLVANRQQELKPGMIGTARIYGARRSLAGLMVRSAFNFLARKVW